MTRTFHSPHTLNRHPLYPPLPPNPPNIALPRATLHFQRLWKLPLQPQLPLPEPHSLVNTPPRKPSPPSIFTRKLIHTDAQGVVLRIQLYRLAPFFL